MLNRLQGYSGSSTAMSPIKKGALVVGGGAAIWYIGLPLLGMLLGPVWFLFKLGLIGGLAFGAYKFVSNRLQ